MPTGFTRTASGFRAWVRVSAKAEHGDSLRTKRGPADTRPADIRAWRRATRDRLQQRLEQQRQSRASTRGIAGTFRADAHRYLAAVTAMTSYTDRCRHVGLWAAIFGDRPRSEIAAHEIRTVRDQWLTVGPRRHWQGGDGGGRGGGAGGAPAGHPPHHPP